MKKTFSVLVSIVFVAFIVSVQTAKAQEDIGRLLKQLEENSDRFSKSLNQALDDSEFNGTNTEDEINGYVKQYEDSTDRLKKDYDKQQDTRVATREVISRAKNINKFLRKNKLNTTVQTDWQTVRQDLTRLAMANGLKAPW
jgi:hypothetical protein